MVEVLILDHSFVLAELPVSLEKPEALAGFLLAFFNYSLMQFMLLHHVVILQVWKISIHWADLWVNTQTFPKTMLLCSWHFNFSFCFCQWTGAHHQHLAPSYFTSHSFLFRGFFKIMHKNSFNIFFNISPIHKQHCHNRCFTNCFKE